MDEFWMFCGLFANKGGDDEDEEGNRCPGVGNVRGFVACQPSSLK